MKRLSAAHSAARRLDLSAALLGISVLTDSGVEHYRGSFQNRAMYAPLVTATLTVAASAMGFGGCGSKCHAVRNAVYALATATGLFGLGFHAYNITKRPGGLSWLNLFYAAPFGAPGALVLAGLLGGSAEKLRDCEARSGARLLGVPAGRLLAALSAVGLAGTVGEVGLLHFRGAYHNPAMWMPVSLPPVAAALLGKAAAAPRAGSSRLARWALRLTTLLGLAGVGFHAYGVSRNMGGWRNWSQNILNGPPLPAPPSFTAIALAGLAALSLLEEAVNE